MCFEHTSIPERWILHNHFISPQVSWQSCLSPGIFFTGIRRVMVLWSTAAQLVGNEGPKQYIQRTGGNKITLVRQHVQEIKNSMPIPWMHICLPIWIKAWKIAPRKQGDTCVSGRALYHAMWFFNSTCGQTAKLPRGILGLEGAKCYDFTML